MITGIKFRKRADDCLREANSVADPERRLAHLDLAERWLQLAAQIDKINTLAQSDAPIAPSQAGTGKSKADKTDGQSTA
jgi:hypothetical protein